MKGEAHTAKTGFQDRRGELSL